MYRADILLPDLDSGAVRLIPSLCMLGDRPYGFRFAVQEGGHWRTLDAVGELDISLEEIAGACGIKAADLAEDGNIDFFEIAKPDTLLLFAKRHKNPLPMGEVKDWPVLLSMTLIALKAGGWIPAYAGMTNKRLQVPPISQMEQDPAIARHICSPVNTLMVARYLTERQIELPPFIAAVHSARRRMYGIWPRAIAAAARQGVAGMVTALSGWDEVAALLQAGLPVIASIAYQTGELTGATVAATRGHLVTITGLTETAVMVNDPAAATAAEVRREYDLEEFSKAWFENKRGVCYLFWK